MSLKLVSRLESEADKHLGDVESIVFHDGNIFTSSDTGLIKVWTHSLDFITEFSAHSNAISQLASNPPHLLSCSSDGSIRLWKINPTNPKECELSLIHLEGHNEPVRKIRASPCKTRLFSGDDEGLVKVWDLTTGENLSTLNLIEEVWDLAVIEDNLLLTARDRNVVLTQLTSPPNADPSTGWTYNRFWTKKVLEGRAPICPIYSEGKRWVASLDRNGMDILIHDLDQEKSIIAKLQGGHSMIVNCLETDGVYLYTGGWDKKVIQWDLSSMKKKDEIELEGYVNDITIFGKDLFVGGENSYINHIQIN